MSNNDGPYEQTGAEFDDRFAEVHERIDTLAESGGGGGDGDLIQQFAAALEPYLDTGGGRSDEEIRQLVAEYVDEHVESGGLSRDDVEQIVTSALADLDIKGFDEEVLERVRHHAEALDFPARRVGPSEPTGSHHQVTMWGLHFRTGRECYIHSAVVHASKSGTFRVRLGKYDGANTFNTVDEVEVSVEGGKNERVDLGLQVPEKGGYLLAVSDEFPLKRGEWNGWDSHMVDNLRLIGGAKPGDFDDNDYYYKLFDLEMTANKNHEFPE